MASEVSSSGLMSSDSVVEPSKAALEDNAPESEQQSGESQETQGFSSPQMSQEVWGRLMPVDEKFNVLELRDPEVSIGRGSQCTIKLPVPQMSNHHCTIHFDENRDLTFLEDCSTNGTWINKKKFSKNKGLINHGDEILFVPASKKRNRNKVAFVFQATARARIEDSGNTVLDSFNDRYRIIKSLGAGAFAEVKLVRQRVLQDSTDSNNNKSLGQIDFAMKEINKEAWQRIQQATARHITLLDEVKIMQKAGKHENIVSVIEYFEQKDKVLVVMDFCDGGDMLDYIQKNGSYTNENARIIFKQLTSAMNYLHNELSIAHRDLKPDNLLLCGKQSEIVKISDFGISRKSSGSMDCKTIIGTPLYQAPEVQIHRHKHRDGYDGKLADLWSLGIILYIMLVAAPPATEPQEIVNMAKMQNLQWYGEPVVETAKDLIYKLLKVEPKRRLKAKEILQHPWLLGFDTKRAHREYKEKESKFDDNNNNSDRKDMEDPNDNNNNNNHNNNNQNGSNGHSNNNHNGSNGSNNNNSHNGSNGSSNGNSNGFRSYNTYNNNGPIVGLDIDDTRCDITPSISIPMSLDTTPDSKYSMNSSNNNDKYSNGISSNSSSNRSKNSNETSASIRELNEKFSQSQLDSVIGSMNSINNIDDIDDNDLRMLSNNSKGDIDIINKINRNNINDKSERINKKRKYDSIDMDRNRQGSNENRGNRKNIGLDESEGEEEDDDIDLFDIPNKRITNTNNMSNNNNRNNVNRIDKKRKCRSPNKISMDEEKFDFNVSNENIDLNNSTNNVSNNNIVKDRKSINRNEMNSCNDNVYNHCESKPPPKKRQRTITATWFIG